jgi:hypothetical protein
MRSETEKKESVMKILLKSVAIAAISIVPANAAFVCTVGDPTGTPLNVRGQPNGTILGALHNGAQESLTTSTTGNG